MHEHFKDMIKLSNERKMNDIAVKIQKAVYYAEAKHPDFPEDIKHQALILAEESGEVVQAVLNYTDHNCHYEPIEDELYQTIAVCIRMLKEKRIV